MFNELFHFFPLTLGPGDNLLVYWYVQNCLPRSSSSSLLISEMMLVYFLH